MDNLEFMEDCINCGIIDPNMFIGNKNLLQIAIETSSQDSNDFYHTTVAKIAKFANYNLIYVVT